MGFTLVQSAGPFSFGGSTNSMTARFSGGSTVGAGHLVVVKIACYGGTTGVSDSQGNNYSAAVQYDNNAVEAYIYYCVTGSGASGFTVTIDGNSFYPTVWLEEWSFVGTLVLENTSQANGSSNAPSPGSITLAAGPNLVLAVISDDSGAGAWTPDSGFTIDGTQTYAGGVRIGGASLYDASATGASANPGATTSSSFTWTAVGAAFYLTSSVSGTTPGSGAVGAGVTSPIQVAFSGPMDPTTLTLSLSPSVGLSAVSWNGGTNTATWTPTGAGLQYDTPYTATINGSSAAEVPMRLPYGWSFTSQVEPPTGSPVAPGVGVQFSAAIIASNLTITATMSATGATFPGTTSYNSTSFVATFTPTSPFVIGTRYIITISGAEASDGSAIPSSSFPFTPGVSSNATWFSGLQRPVMQLGR
jgi:hypothetical protein